MGISLPAPVGADQDSDALYRALIISFNQALSANGLNQVNINGDIFSLSLDLSRMRQGTQSLLSSGTLYTLLANQLAMLYLSHAVPLVTATGSLGVADETGTAAIIAYAEDDKLRGFGAASATIGVVPTMLQTFLLDLITGYLNTNSLGTNLVYNAAGTYTVLGTDSSIIQTTAASVYTLPAAASFKGRTIRLLTQFAGTVTSASSNVVPIAGGAAGTAILAATAGKFADLQSDGTNWIIMTAN